MTDNEGSVSRGRFCSRRPSMSRGLMRISKASTPNLYKTHEKIVLVWFVPQAQCSMPPGMCGSMRSMPVPLGMCLRASQSKRFVRTLIVVARLEKLNSLKRHCLRAARHWFQSMLMSGFSMMGSRRISIGRYPSYHSLNTFLQYACS